MTIMYSISHVNFETLFYFSFPIPSKDIECLIYISSIGIFLYVFVKTKEELKQLLLALSH